MVTSIGITSMVHIFFLLKRMFHNILISKYNDTYNWLLGKDIKANVKCYKNLTYSCKQKIKIHIPATLTFMTKIKVYNQKLLALLLLIWKEVFAEKWFVAILNPPNKTDSIYVNFAKSPKPEILQVSAGWYLRGVSLSLVWSTNHLEVLSSQRSSKLNTMCTIHDCF